MKGQQMRGLLILLLSALGITSVIVFGLSFVLDALPKVSTSVGAMQLNLVPMILPAILLLMAVGSAFAVWVLSKVE